MEANSFVVLTKADYQYIFQVRVNTTTIENRKGTKFSVMRTIIINEVGGGIK